MQPKLTVISGPDQGRVFPLAEGQTLIVGRGASAPTHLTDPHVSRTHCQVEVDGGNFRISDLGSRTGTLVNGRPATKCALKPGDVIRIGGTELRFQLEGTDDTTTMAGPAAPEPAPSLEVEPATSSLADMVGQKIGPYELQAKLATGSSGIIFRAHDAEHKRTVALKVLWPETAENEESVQRFIRAMKTMMPIRHPNIVRIYLAGKTGPHCWLAMEYVDGENLNQVIRRIGTVNMLDSRYAFRVAVHIGRALEEAAKHDIIHRNITPANLLMSKHDQCVKLGDLMLAKALAGAQVRQITRPGQMVGDIFCLSPEQTRDDAQVDCRSDIYNLGTTVYALLAGRPPFAGGSLLQVITQIRQDEPEKPKKYQLSIPDMLEGVVMRMLAKRPEDRYQTATGLLADLERVGKYQGVTV